MMLEYLYNINMLIQNLIVVACYTLLWKFKNHLRNLIDTSKYKKEDMRLYLQKLLQEWNKTIGEFEEDIKKIAPKMYVEIHGFEIFIKNMIVKTKLTLHEKIFEITMNSLSGKIKKTKKIERQLHILIDNGIKRSHEDMYKLVQNIHNDIISLLNNEYQYNKKEFEDELLDKLYETINILSSSSSSSSSSNSLPSRTVKITVPLVTKVHQTNLRKIN